MFIDEHRSVFGVEPICRVLQVAPSTYYAVKSRETAPSSRALRDRELLGEIERVHTASRGLYGARKVWWQLQAEGVLVARCTVERLMRRAGLVGVVRGKAWRTTIADQDADRPTDLVDREFTATAPNRLGGPDGPLRFESEEIDTWILRARAAWRPGDSGAATLRRVS